MSGPLGTHNLADCQLNLNGRRVEGFAEGDAITFEQAAPQASPYVGADGHTTKVVSNNYGVRATINLQSTTRGYRVLAEIAQAQDSGALPSFTFLWLDPHNGDRITEAQAFVTDVPGWSVGQGPSSRTFIIYLPDGRRNMRMGANNLT